MGKGVSFQRSFSLLGCSSSGSVPDSPLANKHVTHSSLFSYPHFLTHHNPLSVNVTAGYVICVYVYPIHILTCISQAYYHFTRRWSTTPRCKLSSCQHGVLKVSLGQEGGQLG